MLVQQSAVNESLRKYLDIHLSKHFQFEQGQSLDDVIREILNNRDIFSFLAVHLPDGKGLRLGAVRSPRHYSVFLNYGFILAPVPRKTALYHYESNVIAHYIDERFHKTFQICDCFPEDYTSVLESSSLFCDEVFHAFLNFDSHLIDLPEKEIA